MRENDRQRPLPQAEADGIIEGRNAVIEALRSGENIDKIYLAKGETDKTLAHIASRAREKGHRGGGGRPAQAGWHEPYPRPPGGHRPGGYAGICDRAIPAGYRRRKGEAPLLVVCDEISDPHNLGAILRTAECAGAHGVIIPKRRSAGLTAIVGKTSAGAVSYMPVARVSNLPATLEELKKKGHMGLWHGRRGGYLPV